jgi:hypothetical protein
MIQFSFWFLSFGSWLTMPVAQLWIVKHRYHTYIIMLIINLIGLVLNLIGTIAVCFSAGSLLTQIHTALMAHQVTLEADLGGHRDVPVFTGLDEGRAKELKLTDTRLKTGLWIIVAGFILQAVAAVAPLLPKS